MGGVERTLVFIKPDGFRDRKIGNIISRFEDGYINILDISMINPSEDQVRKHYQSLEGENYFEKLVKFTLSGPIVLMVLEGESVVKMVRDMVGVTDPKKAGDGTIRGDFGKGVPNNIIHASDSVENACREIDLWKEYLNFKGGNMSDNEFFKMLEDKQDLLDKKEKIQNKINDLEKKIKKSCKHLYTDTKIDYYSGGYLDREEYVSTKFCKHCNKILNETKKLGNFG